MFPFLHSCSFSHGALVSTSFFALAGVDITLRFRSSCLAPATLLRPRRGVRYRLRDGVFILSEATSSALHPLANKVSGLAERSEEKARRVKKKPQCGFFSQSAKSGSLRNRQISWGVREAMLQAGLIAAKAPKTPTREWWIY